MFFIILFFGGIILKNISRISNDFNQSISPVIYDNTNINKSQKVFNTNGQFTHYQQANNIICGFSISPCVHLVINVKKKYFFGYLIYSSF